MLDDPTRLSLEPVEVNDFGYVDQCTGVAASWCPIHGDCTCEPSFDESLDCEGCPLHGKGSDHASQPPQWMRVESLGCWLLIPFEDLTLLPGEGYYDPYPKLDDSGWTFGLHSGSDRGVTAVRRILDLLVEKNWYSRHTVVQIEIPSSLPS